MSNTAVFGIYRDTVSLSGGLEALRGAGFRNTDVSVLLPENAGTKDFVTQKESKAPEGATAGATTGAVVGGIVGWLAGIGALAIPGIGPFIAAGPIIGMLAGAGAVGVAGGIVGTLIGFGIPEYEAKRFEGRVRSGGILLSVHCDTSEWVKRAKKLLDQSGAEDIASSGESSADYAASERPVSRV
ncbi:MAG TPA: quinol:electron acceptor oxidoreductase subunit ActD [Bryobacteraceae bacterium]|nr:quinol:electron acceptor oxidoreductase subunit ActD [Bryobacteraceae bacterium]